jgi:hypothetical protein
MTKKMRDDTGRGTEARCGQRSGWVAPAKERRDDVGRGADGRRR